jgi:trehalose/maltose transport system permease protein
VRALRRIGFWLLVCAILVFALFPFYYALISSLTAPARIFEPAFLPRAPTLENYSAVFREQPFARNILNSVAVASLVVAVSLLLGAMAALAFGRVSFRGRAFLMTSLLAVTMFPQVAVLAGMFELIRWLGLYNNLLGLSLSYLVFTLPFTVWVLTGFVQSLPKELEEAAIMDGAGPWSMLMRVFLPVMAPATVTTGLLAFVAAWNEFLFALTFTLTDERRTVPVAIALMSGSSAYELPWANIMAACVIVTLPLVALVLVFQHRIVAGLAAGAVKG